MEHVEIAHDPANRASGAVATRLGFTEDRHRPAGTGEELVWRLGRQEGVVEDAEVESVVEASVVKESGVPEDVVQDGKSSGSHPPK